MAWLRILLVVCFCSAELFGVTYTYTWTNLQADLAWPEDNNWTSSPVGGTFPGLGDTAVFSSLPGGGTILLEGPQSISSLSISSVTPVISGTSLTIGSGILLEGTSGIEFSSPVITPGMTVLSDILNPCTLIFDDSLSATGNVSLASLGGNFSVTLGGSNSFSSGGFSLLNPGSGSVNLVLGSADALGSGGTAAQFWNLDDVTVQCNVDFASISPLLIGGVNSSSAVIFDTNGFSAALSGEILNDPGTSSAQLIKTGAGTLYLSLAASHHPNTYNGGTIIQDGLIQGDTNTISSNGPIEIASAPAGLQFYQYQFTGTCSAVISDYMGGNGPVYIVGGPAGGTVIFTGANTYSGGTRVTTATLQGFVQPTNPSLQGAFTLVNTDSNLVFNQSVAGTYTAAGPVAISGDGNIVVQNGPLTLVGANTYTGTTTIQKNGILSLSNYTSINSGNLIFNQGTLMLTSPMTITGQVLLNGPGTVTSSVANTMSGVISGVGSLTVTGGGTLTLGLSTINGYSGGTIVQSPLIGSASSLQGTIQIANGTTVTFNQAATGTFHGSLQNYTTSTSGAVVKIGAGTLIFPNANSYSGGTTVSAGTLQGTTTSLQGAILNQATLSFSQATSGTYAGVLSGAGALTITGGGTVTFSGASSSFSGATTVTGGATFNVTDNLSASPITVTLGAFLEGTGSVKSVSNAGDIAPGVSGIGTLTVAGAGGVQFLAGSSFTANVSGNNNGLLSVPLGSVTIDPSATINVNVNTGSFIGFSEEYVLIQANSVPFGNQFASPPHLTSPGFEASISYTPTQVILLLRSLTPFVDFPCGNANECSVAKNLDTISSAGEISSDLFNVVETLAGQSVAAINEALDQMHPAATSALAQMQVELGGQFLSLLQPRDSDCGCRRKNQLWVEPFGNWLHVKQQGMEIGFTTTTRGVVVGLEREFFGFWTLGVAGAYAATDLKWALDRGYCYTNNAWGALYSDWTINRFSLGLSAYGGKDWYERVRHIEFTTIDRQAVSHSGGTEGGAQLHMAYNLGGANFTLYPYAQVDYLYLNNDKFQERGAMALDLTVSSYTSSTLRVETGGGFRLIERNRDRTICLSPFVSMGYVWERPLHRSTYHSKFEGATIPFTTWGWNEVWQLLDLKMGLSLVYRCFTLDSEYIVDVSPEGGSPLVNQRANFRMSYNF